MRSDRPESIHVSHTRRAACFCKRILAFLLPMLCFSDPLPCCQLLVGRTSSAPIALAGFRGLGVDGAAARKSIVNGESTPPHHTKRTSPPTHQNATFHIAD